MRPNELATRLEELGRRYTDQWHMDKEPHSYPDGTEHFNHVRFAKKYESGDLQVVVAKYVAPDRAELLCLLQNNLPTIITALRASSA
jgi:hypothetical protein